MLLSPVHTHLLPPRSGGHNNNSNTGARAKASWPYTANSAHQTKRTGKSSPGASTAFAKIPRENRWYGFWRKYKMIQPMEVADGSFAAARRCAAADGMVVPPPEGKRPQVGVRRRNLSFRV